MEIINLTGYTELEKEHIAFRHLVPKQIEENGLNAKQLHFQSAAIAQIIQRYTREAGVRNLEREIAKACRKSVSLLVRNPRTKRMTITLKRVREMLGVPRYKHSSAEEQSEVGVTSGLAWTQAGGELLITEASIMRGTGRVQLTGKLGDVMKESAQAALSYVRTNANVLGIYSSVFKKTDIHVHVPEGAVPKDGPSAGVTIATSLVSAFTGIPVRHDVAMTGEVTLRGKVLPIGGLKEKLLAAKRGMIRTVLIPKRNEKDLSEVPEEITKELAILSIQHMDEVLQQALERLPVAVVDPPEEASEESPEDSVTVLPQGDYPEGVPAYSHIPHS